MKGVMAVEPERQIKWLERLKSYGKKPDNELGPMKIDGRDCLGFEVKPGASVVYADLGRCKNQRVGSSRI